MKLKKHIAVALLSTLLLTGCSNKTFDKAMEEGKLAIANEEYSKAENMFSLALEEKNNDKEAKALYSQVEKLINAIELYEKEAFTEAKEICNEILKIDSESDIIKKQAKSLSSKLEIIASASVDDNGETVLDTSETDEVNQEKIYTRSEVDAILIEENKGALYDKIDFEITGIEDVYIDGELCYPGQIVWANGNRIRDFFVGSKTLSIYNYEYIKKGTVYSEMIPFDTEF